MDDRSEMAILLEAMNKQMKMIKGLISMLYIQYLVELGDPVKVNILVTLNDLKAQELKEKVDKCIAQIKNDNQFITNNCSN